MGTKPAILARLSTKPPNFVGNFSTRDTKPRSFVTHHAPPGTKPGDSAMRKACGIFAPRAAVYSVTNKRPHSFHLGFSKFLKSHPSLTPQPEAAFRPGPMSSRSPRPFLPGPTSARSPRPLFARTGTVPQPEAVFCQGPGPSRNQRTLLSLLTQLRPIEQNCHCGN